MTDTQVSKIFERDDDLRIDEDESLLTADEVIEPVGLELTKPIEVNGVETEMLIIHPLTGKGLRAARRSKQASDVDTFFKMAEQCCQCPVKELEELHTRDIRRLSTVIGAFM